jgi:UDP-2,4-diacetamido-2,4,6-trideoxy-beta-L-altropyranose hydrolase
MMTPSAKTLTIAEQLCPSDGWPFLWIRTHAGPQIGFGHLRRCMVLARSLLDCSRPIFLLDPEDCWSREQLANQGFDYFCETLDKAWTLLPEPNAVLIDTRRVQSLEYLLKIARNRGIPVISIHDLGLSPLPSDILIDGSIAPAFQEANSQYSTILTGTDFMILDPVYHLLHQRRKRISQKIQSIFINLGGGDSHQYYSRVLEGLRLWAHEAEVVAVPGFISWGQKRLEEMDWYPLRFRWEYAATDQFLFRADLAITAGGLAAYEALCTGTPLLALSFDSLQQVTIRALAAAGACIDLGSGDDLDPRVLAATLSKIGVGCNARKILSMRGRKIVDGRGAARVSEIIRRVVGSGEDADRQRLNA